MKHTGYDMRSLPKMINDEYKTVPFEFDIAIDFIRGVLPDFPDNLDELEEYLNTMFVELIKDALKRFLKVCVTTKKEVQNVLKTTIPNVEQSELLFEEVPQS